MLRNVWKPVAASVVTGAPAYYLYSTWKTRETFELPIRVRQADGSVGMSTKTIPLLTLDEVNVRLNERATAESILRPNGIKWNYANASLPSNNPIEDAHSKEIVARDATDPSKPGDFAFFAMFDGHGGYETSSLLSQILIKAVSLELSKLIAAPTPSLAGRATSLFSAASAPSNDPARVADAIKLAFTNLDWELINAPLRIIAQNIDEESRKKKLIPDLSQHPLAMKVVEPAISGSCALMAIFDTVHEDLYVACTGDARAVGGAYSDGQWSIDVLSEDQTGRNPKEKARMQAEHPADEAENVIRRGRVLGGLEPTRAFGDARYKWPREIHELISNVFMKGAGRELRPQPSALKTPPYVTAKPEIEHRKVSFRAGTSSFCVLATDGLWDELSSEEVAQLVILHLAGKKGDVPRAELSALVPTTATNATIQGKDARRQRKSGSWAFQDDNVAVHLIRNALGGGDEAELRQLVSIPAPLSRRHRDDITVTVVWWEGDKEQSVKAKL
ncbi:protein serine/threonine phosphatase 2C [Cylindrobasidium torrendii FP15055 ss-10]|uniref:Protein serine/threonine phosphatase 2C n=1 Tax=Cylindrobasidium torrendii FP15055 ss-10 TaxID=1314674 RepID=A0A0D7BJE8_9AGAR|nr:protein serine/threonine phosphatase 2C [Cylindrobasidium torrendii FP15055 ss-10]